MKGSRPTSTASAVHPAASVLPRAELESAQTEPVQPVYQQDASPVRHGEPDAEQDEQILQVDFPIGCGPLLFIVHMGPVLPF